MSPFAEESFQWKGTNFPELYEWLTGHSINKNLKLRIVTPGQPNSSIEINIDNAILYLSVGDIIVRTSDGSYFVIEDYEIID